MFIGKVKSFQDSLTDVIVVHICLMQCKNMLVASTEFFNSMNSYLNIFAIFIVLFMYARLFFKYREGRSVNIGMLLVLVVVVCWCFVSFLYDPKLFVDTEFPYNYVRKQALSFIAYGLPLFWACACLKDSNLLLEKFFRSTPILLAVALVSFVLHFVFTSGAAIDYSMSYGNNLLLCSILLMFKYIKYNKITDLLMFGATILLTLGFGSRGPLVSMLVVILIAIFMVKRTKLNVLIIIMCAAIIPIVLIFYKPLFNFLYTALKSIGIESRTFWLIAEGMVGKDSGRNYHHETIFAALEEKPWGLGAFGGEKTVGLAHGFYIDVLANMGYIVGVLFLAVFIFAILKQLIKNRNSARTMLILIFAIILLPRGFFDESLWGAWQFWMILGLLISAREGNLKEKRLKKAREY